MDELTAIKTANALNTAETGQDRYWAVCVLYNWVIYKAPGGFRDMAHIYMIGKEPPA